MSQCGRWKVGLTCYAVRLAFWGQCLAVYVVGLAFEGGVSHWKWVPGQCLDGLLAESVRVAVFSMGYVELSELTLITKMEGV
jgi:hypothetical protein